MKERYPVLDVMKGVAIFLVVAGHVLAMCIRGIDRAPLFKFIGEIHMPLFFFVSGFLTLRRGKDGGIVMPGLGQRAVRLLLPMVAVSSLWVLWFPLSGLESPLPEGFAGLWGDEWKNGYWFTPVLFVITVLYIPSALLLSRLSGLWSRIAAIAAVWCVLAFAVDLLPPTWISAASLSLVVRFYPVFMAGAVAADCRAAFTAFCGRSSTQTVALAASALLISYVGWYWRYPAIPAWCLDVARPLLHIALAVLAFGVMSPWAARDTATVRMWSFLGRKSLAIYLLHYFFLFPAGGLRPLLESTELAIVPTAVVAAAVAAAIVAVVLIIDYVISFSAPLALLLTGARPKPETKAPQGV